MGHSPAVIGLYDTAGSFLTGASSLDDATREAIHLTVSAVNDCDYCQAAYTGAASARGFSDDQTVQIRRGHVDGNEQLTALLQVAREIAAHTGYVEDLTWKEAFQAGWNERQLLDAYAEVVRTILTNYFNHLVGAEVDLPAPPQLNCPVPATPPRSSRWVSYRARPPAGPS